MTSLPDVEVSTPDEPSTEEVILPPLALFCAFVCVVLLLYLFTRKVSGTLCLSSKHKIKPEDKGIIFVKSKSSELGDTASLFLTDWDMCALHTFKSFPNNLMGLLKICIVPSLSLLFCPMLLYLYTPIVNYCWPKDRFSSPPNINDAIACFLVPAGMVYAFVFGFALQQVYGQFCNVEEKINTEVNIIREIISLISCFSHVSKQDYIRVLFLLKERILDQMLLIQNAAPYVIKVNPWNVIHLISGNQRKNDMDASLQKELVRCVRILSNLSPEGTRQLINSGLHFFNWFFIEALSYICFVGVLLIKAESYQIQLGMCITTVVSITLLSYAVSDMDSPFHGFIRVDLSGIVELVEYLEKTAREVYTQNTNIANTIK